MAFTSPITAAPASLEHALLGLGNPLLDISADVPDTLLAKYGLDANSAILADEKHAPLYPELVADFKAEFVAGGATQNSIRGAQWLLPKGSTVYIGSVGKDKYAEELRLSAEADGVLVKYHEVGIAGLWLGLEARLEDKRDAWSFLSRLGLDQTAFAALCYLKVPSFSSICPFLSFVNQDTAQTGTCAVLLTSNGANRSLVANLSAANNYKPTHLQSPEIWSIATKAQVYYIEGYFFTVSPESIQLLAKHACENNKIFAQNLSAPFLPQFFTAQMDEASPYWDILFGNESEFETWATAHNYADSKDLKAVALEVSKLPKANAMRDRMVVITQGADPVIVAYKGEVREFDIIKIAKEQILDTNGAGELFEWSCPFYHLYFSHNRSLVCRRRLCRRIPRTPS